MRVGLILYGSIHTLSGGFIYDRKLVEHLQNQGDEITILSMPWEKYSRLLLQNWQKEWRDRIADLKVDILLQDELNHPSLFWLNQKIRQQIDFPIISIVHHLRSSEKHPPLALAFYRQIEKKYLHTVDGFIFNSQTTRKTVEDLSGKPVSGIVAHPAGDLYGIGMDREEVISRCQNEGPLKILFVGNLIPRKGLHTLLLALENLSELNWTLEIVGRQDVDPDYVAELKKQVMRGGLDSRVTWLDRLEDEQMKLVFRRSQVLVMPSSYEGFGIVYLEGMAFGLPAIASLAGAAHEIITPGKNGVLVPPEDVGAMETVLRKLCKDRNYLETLSLGAWQRFAEFPSWEESMASARNFLLEWLKTGR